MQYATKLLRARQTAKKIGIIGNKLVCEYNFDAAAAESVEVELTENRALPKVFCSFIHSCG
jgi:hypothetical protein